MRKTLKAVQELFFILLAISLSSTTALAQQQGGNVNNCSGSIIANIQPGCSESSSKIIEPPSFPWAMFLPVFIAGGAKLPIWGARSYVCCTGGPYTFTITGDETTKSSTRNNCGSDGTWEGSVESAAGVRNFTWNVSGSGCPVFSGSFSHTFERGKAYRIEATWTGSTVQIETLEFDN